MIKKIQKIQASFKNETTEAGINIQIEHIVPTYIYKQSYRLPASLRNHCGIFCFIITIRCRYKYNRNYGQILFISLSI